MSQFTEVMPAENGASSSSPGAHRTSGQPAGHPWYKWVLELIGPAVIAIAAVSWMLEADERAKEHHYLAWELINSARGSSGDGGRKDALQDLNSDGVSLAAAPLEKAHLTGVNLAGADLLRASLNGAVLTDANLKGSKLTFANLNGAILLGAKLEGASLMGANLKSAFLMDAKLEGAVLVEANLADANLRGADLKNAILANANLKGAELEGANLEGAIVVSVNLNGADLTGAKGLAQEQLNDSMTIGDDQTRLPEGLTRPQHWGAADAEQPLRPHPTLWK